MTDQSEYTLKQAPTAYSWQVDGIVLSGGMTFFLTIVLFAASRFAAVSQLLLAALVVSWIIAALTFVLLILRVRKRFPDWRTFHEKKLPPKENPELLKSELSLAMSRSIWQTDNPLSYFFCFIGAGMLLCFAISGMSNLPLLLIGTVTILTCVFSIAREKRIRNVSESVPVRLSASAITFPVCAFEVLQANKYAKAKLTEVTLPWHEITEWTVDCGGSDSPDLYLLKLNDGRTLEIYRSNFIGRELKLLEYVRAAGVPIVLRDSIVR